MLLAPTAPLCLAVLGWIEPAGGRLVVCSFRTGELELFAVDPASGDAINLTRSPKSVEKYPACSFAGDRVASISNRDGTDNLYVMNADGSEVRQPTSPSVSRNGRWITSRLCDEVYWRSGESSERAYRERRADKRPVWIMKADGSDPHVVEPLHYQTTIDGSRAPFLE
jgi:Tol biopolymer transport system component